MRVRLDDGPEIVSTLATETCDELALTTGHRVTVLIQSTAVLIVEPEEDPGLRAR